jgi:hypothetical protein
MLCTYQNHLLYVFSEQGHDGDIGMGDLIDFY